MFENTLPAFVSRALDILKNAGADAWLVGGCVRDAMLGLTPHDYDIATDFTPEKTLGAFNGFTVIETGLKHGTVTVHIDGNDVEITTFRRDGEYEDSRHPSEVTFVSDIETDLARRDFTVNAAAWSPAHGLCDPFGARDDISRGVIRCVGDPRKRFGEDALRILRALRFASALDFGIDGDTSAAIREMYGDLANVSRERIRVELVKLICGKGMVGVMLDYSDVISYIIPEMRPCIGYDTGNARHKYDVYEHCVRTANGVSPNTVVRFAALLHDTGKPECCVTEPNGRTHFPRHETVGARIAGEVMRRLKFSRAETNDVCRIIARHDSYPKPKRASVRRDIVEVTSRLWRTLEELRRADNAAKAKGAYSGDDAYFTQVDELADAIFADGDCLDPSSLAVSGAELMTLGASGVVLGDIKRRIFDDVVDGKIQNDRDQLMDRARELFEKYKEKRNTGETNDD